MSNIYNFYIGGGNPSVDVKGNKPDVDISQYVGEIEELKNEVMAEKQKTKEAIEELQDFRYQIYAELTALTLSHGGKLKLNTSMYEFVLTHRDKASLEFVAVADGKEYIARMEEVANANQ